MRQGGARLPAEDINQVIGQPTAKKYRVSAPAVVRLLREHGVDAMTFVRQLAFNVYIGNADAHAKNYALLLSASRVTLAPIFDTVPDIPLPAVRSQPGDVDRQSQVSG